ncbi:MAG: hypothetical protein KDB67_03870 [Gordonia sp.]|jgi:uncharacterized protein YciI|uniref:YciI family protein n=1 Tax=Gordonia sp. (in: high G+C Gram-positive bacteria) TaxID=84139 RepID=UPI001E197C1C|nr:YciI family protein [Gordonia sp. (in: high G+C Gram-positive bacteria)]MCB1293805.1 hypothetical protein [Gordonia sp. (in: high G+C Gram-positive bacteria)]
MIVVIGTNRRAYARTDGVFEAHRQLMTELLADGTLVCSGPRDGGSVIILRLDDEQSARDLFARDPLVSEGYVELEIHRFTVGLADPATGLAERVP